jgi:hypothetical protein
MDKDVKKLLELIQNNNVEGFFIQVGRKYDESEFKNIPEKDIIDMIVKYIQDRMNSDDVKKCIEKRYELVINDEFILCCFIIATNDPKYIKKCIEEREITKKILVVNLIKALGPEGIEKYLSEPNKLYELGINAYNITDLIISLGQEGIERYLSEMSKLDELGLDNEYDITELIKALGPEGIEKYLSEPSKLAELGLKASYIAELIEALGTEGIERYLSEPSKLDELGLKKDDKVWLIRVSGINENINNIPLVYNLGLDHTVFEEDIIYDNLDVFLEYEGYSDKKDVLIRMYKKNNEVIKCDFKILEDRFLKTIGEDRINMISCFPYIVEQTLKLNENQLVTVGKVLDLYQKENQTDEWTNLYDEILKHIAEYDDLINSIDFEKLTEKDIKVLMKILPDENVYKLNDFSQLDEYETKQREKCIEMIQSDDIRLKIEAIFLDKFGISTITAKEILKKYGKDIDEIENNDLKYLIKSMEAIISISDIKILEAIWEEVNPSERFERFTVERCLKSEYANLYVRDLFQVKDAKLIEGFGEDIYELPEDENGNIKEFNMIITSIAPFVLNVPENFCEDWNRPSIASQHFCTNYIRRDMLGRAPMPYLYYGFSRFGQGWLNAFRKL